MEEIKNCTHCQKEISKKATRCPHCQADLRSWVNRHPILTILLAIIGIGILSSLFSSRSQTPASTTNAATSATPTVPEAANETSSSPSWHVAYTYSNDTDIKTPPFTMHGSEWKITYTCGAATPDYFGGDIASAKDGSYISEIANHPTCPTTQSSYAYGQSPGQYYLDLSSNGPTYSVTIHQQQGHPH